MTVGLEEALVTSSNPTVMRSLGTHLRVKSEELAQRQSVRGKRHLVGRCPTQPTSGVGNFLACSLSTQDEAFSDAHCGAHIFSRGMESCVTSIPRGSNMAERPTLRRHTYCPVAVSPLVGHTRGQGRAPNCGAAPGKQCMARSVTVNSTDCTAAYSL